VIVLTAIIPIAGLMFLLGMGRLEARLLRIVADGSQEGEPPLPGP
jgi:hypothetical protein